jgi:hypothetical protein
MKDKIINQTKHFCKKKWNQFTFWFTKKEHPRSILNKNVFFHDLLKVIGLILVFLIVYSNVDKLNQIVLIFIKIGSLLQLVLLFFILRKVWHLTINLKYFFRGLNHGTKAIIAIALVLLLFMAFQNQEKVVDSVVESYEKTEFQKFNPINANLNLSSLNLKGITKQLNTCPQIDVPINFPKYGDPNIKGQTYDGWKVKGSATCRKGTKEGENLNRYYCGGYESFMGIGSVNAYVEKTTISDDGDIGKTYKYVIWNIYDENKNFVETRCIGDPDEFDKKQAESFYNEMLKWS